MSIESRSVAFPAIGVVSHLIILMTSSGASQVWRLLRPKVVWFEMLWFRVSMCGGQILGRGRSPKWSLHHSPKVFVSLGGWGFCCSVEMSQGMRNQANRLSRETGVVSSGTSLFPLASCKTASAVQASFSKGVSPVSAGPA